MMDLCHPATGRPPMFTFPTVQGTVGEFGWSRKNRDGSPKFHRGVDWGLEPGSRIFAGHDGKITRGGQRGADMEESGGKGFGQRIYLQGLHGEQTILTIYAHLSVQFVLIGDKIRAGHCLGLSGMSGNLTTEPPHCHHEVRLGGVGKPDAVNPVWFYHGSRYPRMGIGQPGGD